MTTLYVLDVPENTGIAKLAAQAPGLTVGRVGPYFEIISDGPITIDREASGARQAVWYSMIAGIADGRVVQHDKFALRVEPA
jgi:hypothetical protein